LRKRAAVLLGCLALACPAAASAHRHTIAPPGNSGVGQYVEVVPTATGGRTSSSVHPHPGVGGGGGPIGPSTQRTLESLGTDGAEAAGLAEATAPARVHRQLGTTSGSKLLGRRGSSLSERQGSPAGQVLRTFAGSAGGGGLGIFLPVILIGSFLAAGGISLLRRRGSGE
jgi:hypothetical protein